MSMAELQANPQRVEIGPMIYKAVDWFLWGFFMGMGWIVGTNVLNFIGSFMHR